MPRNFSTMVLKYHFGGRVVLYGKLRRNSLLCIYVGMLLPKATRAPIFRRNFLPKQIEKSNRRQHFLAEAKKKQMNGQIFIIFALSKKT